MTSAIKVLSYAHNYAKRMFGFVSLVIFATNISSFSNEPHDSSAYITSQHTYTRRFWMARRCLQSASSMTDTTPGPDICQHICNVSSYSLKGVDPKKGKRIWQRTWRVYYSSNSHVICLYVESQYTSFHVTDLSSNRSFWAFNISCVIPLGNLEHGELCGRLPPLTRCRPQITIENTFFPVYMLCWRPCLTAPNRTLLCSFMKNCSGWQSKVRMQWMRLLLRSSISYKKFKHTPVQNFLFGIQK